MAVFWSFQRFADTPWRKPMDDLIDIIDRLILAEVDFVLVGGLAAVAHELALRADPSSEGARRFLIDTARKY